MAWTASAVPAAGPRGSACRDRRFGASPVPAPRYISDTMPVSAATANPTRADEYRRQARRLRATLAPRPTHLHRKLRELADRHDAAAAEESVPCSALPHRHDRRAGAFAEEVAARMNGPVLRYSQRKALMSAAQRVGIGRFEANLIIAAVRHRQVAGHASHVPAENAVPRRALSFVPVVVVLAVESLVALGIWRIWSA